MSSSSSSGVLSAELVAVCISGQGLEDAADREAQAAGAGLAVQDVGVGRGIAPILCGSGL
jgi:hypothetical protein